MVAPRVLFVSKPVVPPWNDGSKNLVRDIATHLRRACPTVLTSPGAPPLGGRVKEEPIYRSPGRFAPGLVANSRVLDRLVRGDPHDVWNFVFAPNLASSSAARTARRARRLMGWRGKVVQTVASAPRRFEGVSRLLFGDVVVALSEWTRARLIGAGADGSRLRVIPPCADAPPSPADEVVQRARRRYGLGDAPFVLYPGDYEVSRGAATFADSLVPLARLAPSAMFVFACREKTPRAAEARTAVIRRVTAAGLAAKVRHVGEIEDLHPLMSAAAAVAFPVDDLYGKVDLPLVLIEALALGVPLVLARGGPLETISTASFVEPGDAAGLATALAALLADEGEARAQSFSGKALHATHFSPRTIAARYDDLYEEILTQSP